MAAYQSGFAYFAAFAIIELPVVQFEFQARARSVPLLCGSDVQLEAFEIACKKSELLVNMQHCFDNFEFSSFFLAHPTCSEPFLAQ